MLNEQPAEKAVRLLWDSSLGTLLFAYGAGLRAWLSIGGPSGQFATTTGCWNYYFALSKDCCWVPLRRRRSCQLLKPQQDTFIVDIILSGSSDLIPLSMPNGFFAHGVFTDLAFQKEFFAPSNRCWLWKSPGALCDAKDFWILLLDCELPYWIWTENSYFWRFCKILVRSRDILNDLVRVPFGSVTRTLCLSWVFFSFIATPFKREECTF